MWYWAASIQMVLNYHGLYVTQEQIVQRVFGLPLDTPAYLQHILYALTGWAPGHRRASICQYLRSKAIGSLHLTYESQGGCAVEVICSGAQYRQNPQLWAGSLRARHWRRVHQAVLRMTHWIIPQ